MSLFVIGSFFAFITAANSTVTSTVIAPSISHQSQAWLGSLNSASQDLKKQHVVRTVSLKVNHQRQESISKIDTDYQKSKEEFLQQYPSHKAQAQAQESYIQESPVASKQFSAGIDRSLKKSEKIVDKAIEKIKLNIAGIKLKFDNSQFADDELFPQGIDEQMFGDEAFNDPRSYTQKAFDEESKAEIEKSVQDALVEVNKQLVEDSKNELAFFKRSNLRMYRYDPKFMELYLARLDKFRPGIKRDFKDFLFSKKVFSKEKLTKMLEDFNFIKQEMNFDESAANIDHSEAAMIKQIDDYNERNKKSIESLHLNYPEFAELSKQIKYEQKLLSVNNDLLDNTQDLIDLLESSQEDELTVRKKRSLEFSGINVETLKAAKEDIKGEISGSETKIHDLNQKSQQYPEAIKAIDSQSITTMDLAWLFVGGVILMFVVRFMVAVVSAIVLWGVLIFSIDWVIGLFKRLFKWMVETIEKIKCWINKKNEKNEAAGYSEDDHDLEWSDD